MTNVEFRDLQISLPRVTPKLSYTFKFSNFHLFKTSIHLRLRIFAKTDIFDKKKQYNPEKNAYYILKLYIMYI